MISVAMEVQIFERGVWMKEIPVVVLRFFSSSVPNMLHEVGDS